MHPILKREKMHTGIDIRASFGVPVVASGSGRVIIAEWYGSYGRTVIIDHGSGIMTLYAHNDQIEVTKGQLVKAGEVISMAGSTGMSTGPHIHFEVRKNGKPVNPMDWLGK
jgi:murein DD-endopeptidase MepM/ murein hydrolase activator NlpD